MTRDEAIEAGARALRNSMFPLIDIDDAQPVAAGWRATAAAVLDAIGWAEPVGYLAAEPGALIGAYPTRDEAVRSGWGQAVYAVVPVQGTSKLDANEGGE